MEIFRDCELYDEVSRLRLTVAYQRDGVKNLHDTRVGNSDRKKNVLRLPFFISIEVLIWN